MAGSYKHAVTDAGNLYRPHQLANMVENAGDVYEMAEEMYGMIWWLASTFSDQPKAVVEEARQNYRDGLAAALRANATGTQDEDDGPDDA